MDVTLPVDCNVSCAVVTKTDFSFCFFPQFEKEKQHDIRSFFSPGASKEKKRKRTEGEEPSPSISSEATATPTDGGRNSEKREEEKEKPCSQTSATPDQDFSPQLKRLRAPQPSPSSRFAGKRRSAIGGVSPSASAYFMAPRKLSEPNPPTETWSCGACTYSNSSLLPYCEMCEFPCSSSGVRSGRITKQQII